jgi:hypothetical protein
MTRILVTGSRDWPAEHISVITDVLGTAVIYALEQGVPKSEITIIHGACPKGADAMADWIARFWGMPIERHPADWDTFGKSAGFVRNTSMVASSIDICLAFVYNKSKGASMTVDLCRKQNIPVVLIER